MPSPVLGFYMGAGDLNSGPCTHGKHFTSTGPHTPTPHRSRLSEVVDFHQEVTGVQVSPPTVTVNHRADGYQFLPRVILDFHDSP